MSVSGRWRPPALLNASKRLLLVAVSIVLGASSLVLLAPSHSAQAATLTSRSLTLQTGAGGDGGSKPGGVVNHLFSFTIASQNFGSVKLLYCTTASDPAGVVPNQTCTAPSGLSVTGVTLGSFSGWSPTGVTTGTTPCGGTNVCALVSAASSPSTSGAITVTLNGVTNPSAPNSTFFVRIFTYANTAGTGTPTDYNSVAASTATQIQLKGTMPESLIFCTGATIPMTVGNQPTCGSATLATVNFNQLFSPQMPAWAFSQFAASTNAGSGYAITVAGPTMTSGSNTIPAIGGTAATDLPGTGQFGMTVADTTYDPYISSFGGNTPTNPITYYDDGNSHPINGAVYPSPNGTNYKGQPKAPFDTTGTAFTLANQTKYAFVAGSANTVAASDNGGAGATDAQRFTATYIVNVTGSQAAGDYVSTLTYICTPTF